MSIMRENTGARACVDEKAWCSLARLDTNGGPGTRGPQILARTTSSFELGGPPGTAAKGNAEDDNAEDDYNKDDDADDIDEIHDIKSLQDKSSCVLKQEGTLVWVRTTKSRKKGSLRVPQDPHTT
ncbi:hypothetical protein DPMN_034163 [Dreissena polymorpha]|uniref:Uncharacterized protein n=1 Tax=Dreissena polymorpha TaxID=45954 RepID=A0A9D4M835_DREPO|nr:hypothetical protein DPMN_034163 [Dreissena polymorpha]